MNVPIPNATVGSVPIIDPASGPAELLNVTLLGKETSYPNGTLFGNKNLPTNLTSVDSNNAIIYSSTTAYLKRIHAVAKYADRSG